MYCNNKYVALCLMVGHIKNNVLYFLLDNMHKNVTAIKDGLYYPLIKVDNNVLSREMVGWWVLIFPFLFLQSKMDIQPLIKLM